MSAAPGTVFIIDDDPSFLRATTRQLRARGFEVVAFGSAQAFLAGVDPAAVGCVLTDYRMPGMNGLELQETLGRSGCLMPVVFLTGHGDIPTTVQAMRRGAVNFLTKTASIEAQTAAVEEALRLGRQRSLERDRLAALQRLFAALSSREHEVLQHVLQGKLNKQIASDLGIHERTVKLHRAAISRKLGVRSVAELARLARDAGMA